MLLVVVLTMIVALTVGLSVVSRTVTNLRISRQNEESQRAFQAAEAGIEQALQSSTDKVKFNFSNSSTYTTTTTPLSGQTFLLNGGDVVDQDAGIDLWLSDYPTYANPKSPTLTFYWVTNNQACSTRSGDGVAPAIEIAVLYGNYLSPNFKKYVYDPCGRIPNPPSVISAGTQIENIDLTYKATISITNGLLAKIIPLYNSTKIGISSSIALPSQGTVIESVGESGDTVRRVKYFSSHPQVPLEIFPYSIISQ